MTLADTAQPVHDPGPVRRRGQRLIIGISILLLLVAGGITASTYYYDSVPLAESDVSYPVVTELPAAVADAFVAAVDPDFYSSGNSLITRRYTAIASGAGERSGLRTRVLMRKAEAAYPKTEILERYLNRADYGRDAVGLVAAARAYFQKPAEQLTVAEAALLAVQLDPDRPAPRAGWDQVLDTMVKRGWLSAAERNGLTFPG
jgi:transglycosylase-like protein